MGQGGVVTRCHVTHLPCSLPGGDLASHVRESVVLSEMETSRFTRQIFEGLQYLHKSNIIHSNIRVMGAWQGRIRQQGVHCLGGGMVVVVWLGWTVEMP